MTQKHPIAAWPGPGGTSRSRRRSAALLAALLLFALWPEAQHMADVEGHSGTVCEVCLFAGATGHGMAPTASALLPGLGSADRPMRDATGPIPSFLSRRVHGPRGPPARS